MRVSLPVAFGLLLVFVMGKALLLPNLEITRSFVWYDLWVGVFIDTKTRAVYICPLPCRVIKIQLMEVINA